MPDRAEWLPQQFEKERPRLRAVAYRLLGSVSDAEDAVQEAWLRLERSDRSDVENLPGWLTTVVARISLNMLRSRATRREDPLDTYVPDPIVDPPGGTDPAEEVLVADSVGLALLVVLETLSPAERLAFVLHDVFALPFDEIGAMVDRSPEAARQLASRARRRVRAEAPPPDGGLAAQREVIEAFLAAARDGRLDELVAVLHPGVVVRSDFGPTARASNVTRGSDAVARRARMFARAGREARPVIVNGAAGIVMLAAGRPVAVAGFTVVAGRIAAIDVLGDPRRLARLDLCALGLLRASVRSTP